MRLLLVLSGGGGVIRFLKESLSPRPSAALSTAPADGAVTNPNGAARGGMYRERTSGRRFTPAAAMLAVRMLLEAFWTRQDTVNPCRKLSRVLQTRCAR